MAESDEKPKESKSTVSSKDEENIQKWFEEKIAHASTSCPMCAAKNWSIGRDFISPLISNHSGILELPTKRFYPMFFLACNNCGNIQLFSAIATGIVEGDK